MAQETAIAEKKCLFIINQNAPFKAVHDHIKKLNGLYNGVGWYVENKHKEAVLQICEEVSLKCLEDFPYLEDNFDALRRKLKAPYLAEKSFKKYWEVERLRELLNIPKGIDLSELGEDFLKQLEQIPDGRKFLDASHEHDALQKQIKRLEEEERLEKLHLNTSGSFSYLLEPASEEKIREEIQNTSPGVNVGFKIGDIELKLPGGAISILAGPTSHGKTTQLINFSLGALKDPTQSDKSVYFFSYEESRSAIVSLFLNTYIGEYLSANNRESIKSYFRIDDMRFMTS